MTSYATDEEKYECDMCEALPTMREMTAKAIKDLNAPGTLDNDGTNYHCPGCDTHLLTTSKYGLLRVFHFGGSVPYIRTDGVNEPVEIEGL